MKVLFSTFSGVFVFRAEAAHEFEVSCKVSLVVHWFFVVTSFVSLSTATVFILPTSFELYLL